MYVCMCAYTYFFLISIDFFFGMFYSKLSNNKHLSLGGLDVSRSSTVCF